MPLPSKTGNNSCPTELPSIRASLLVLIQHSIVSIRVKRQKAKQLEYSYIYHPDRARYLQRYARYMDYIKKAMDVTAACLINTLLLAGRLRTIDVVLHTHARPPVRIGQLGCEGLWIGQLDVRIHGLALQE